MNNKDAEVIYDSHPSFEWGINSKRDSSESFWDGHKTEPKTVWTLIDCFWEFETEQKLYLQ